MYKKILPDGTVKSYRQIVATTFTLSDVDDFEIYIAQPILEWQQSEAGKFIMSHAVEPPKYHNSPDVTTFGHKIAITAVLEEQHISFFNLKFK